MKKALITGITGQDDAYLAEFLLKKDYEVRGIKRSSSLFNTSGSALKESVLCDYSIHAEQRVANDILVGNHYYQLNNELTALRAALSKVGANKA